jgi:hypothetical protein
VRGRTEAQYRKRGESFAKPRPRPEGNGYGPDVQGPYDGSEASGAEVCEHDPQYRARGGERGLGIPNVIDRVVQEAVRGVIGPRYESKFHASSHGFRPKRSCHTAIAEAKTYLKDGYNIVVDIDLKDFFNRVF